MGDRANYVVKERGTRSLYYAHWGSVSVLSDFFWGPRFADAFLGTQERVDEDDGWLDDVFGEGGVAIDKDQKILTIDGGEFSGATRALAIELMQAVWGREGFRVRDARGFADLAEAVGVPRARVEAVHHPRTAIDVDDPAQNGTDQAWMIVVKDGVARGAAAGGEASVLELGAARVHELDRLTPLAAVKAPTDGSTLADRLMELVVVDTVRRSIAASPWWFGRGPARRYYRALWPGFVLEEHDGAHAWLRAHPQPNIDVGDDEEPSVQAQLTEIERALFAERADPGKLMTAVFARLQAAEAEGAEVFVNPSALKPTGDGRPRLPAARAIFRWAVRDVVGDTV